MMVNILIHGLGQNETSWNLKQKSSLGKNQIKNKLKFKIICAQQYPLTSCNIRELYFYPCLTLTQNYHFQVGNQ